jgi:pimeloyl-ACP methyl ester carboxylesterase
MTYVLVHGGMCGGWVWTDVAEHLTATGRDVVVVEQLPSGGADAAALGDLRADADHVRATLAEIDNDVVLVGHSYGGMVLSELADHPKVRRSVYLTAVWPHRGQALFDMWGGVLPGVFTRRGDAIALTDDFAIVWETFGRGLDRASAEKMASRFVLQSMASLTAPSTSPDRRHPTTYMIAERELDSAVAAQEAWASNADHVTRLPGAHMLMLNQPDVVADALLSL